MSKKEEAERAAAEQAKLEREAEEARRLAEQEAERLADGLARMVAPEGCTECSYDGSTFTVGADGLVYVPQEAVVQLLSHGFSVKGGV